MTDVPEPLRASLEPPPLSLSPTPKREVTGLVMSGGGVRGAYEAGVVAGIVEVLGLHATDPSPFKVFTGTSVGAINAAFFASNAQQGHLGAEELVRVYKRLDIRDHLRLNPWSVLPGGELLRRARLRWGAPPPERVGRSLVDPRPLEELIKTAADWRALDANIGAGTVRALIIAALNVASGNTTLFTHLAPGVIYREPRAPRHIVRRERITPEHVLASAAIPVVFPARRVGRSYYSDGGLRFNTPIAPALRAGATRIVVISLLSERFRPLPAEVELDHYPSLGFLAGKLLNALLLDPVAYDLQVLERLNRLMETVENTLDHRELEGVQRTLMETRGAPYRRIRTLVFHPTRDIGRVAGEHLRRLVSRVGSSTWLSRHLASRGDLSSFVEADLASYLLFDGEFAGELVEMGRADALSRAADIQQFFAEPTRRGA